MSVQSAMPVLQLTAENPWPGLWPYDENAKAFFFGRQAETEVLFRLVRRETLAVFYGQSGLGKTSLLQAGLFPKLREAGLLPVLIRLDYSPKAALPLTQAKRAVADALQAEGIDARPPAEEESLWEYFHSAGVDFWDNQNRLVTLVLVLDQFEERFTLGRQSPESDSQAETFLAELSQLVENRPPPALRSRFEQEPSAVVGFDFDKRTCKVILSLREDFLPELESLHDRFPLALENSYRLQGMNEVQAMAVILNPAAQMVSESVAAEIVQFVSGSEQRQQGHCTVEPVLLSVVLFELNQRRRQNGQSQITSDLLVGSREQILAGFYENALSGLPPQACIFIEEGLLTSTGRRDSLAWENVLGEYGVGEDTLRTLINRHLLRREDRREGSRVELVHDRLAEVVRLRREVRHEEERQAKEREAVRAREQDLMRQREDQRRRVQRLAWISLVFALFGIAMAALGLYAWQQSAKAKTALQQSQIERGLAEKARAEAEKARAEAEMQKRQVQAALQEAEAQRKKAETSRVEAERQKAIAEAALEKSRKSLADAQEQKTNALASFTVAEKERARAKEAEQEARKQQSKVESMMNFMVRDLSVKLRPFGRADLLRSVTEQVLTNLMATTNRAESDDSLNLRFKAFMNLGDARALQGESTNAIEAFRTCLGIAERLCAQGGGTNQWRTEMAGCHQRIGDVWYARGESQLALEEFEKSLDTARRLATESSDNPRYQSCLMDSYSKLADLFYEVDEKNQAATNVLAALRIAQALDQANPGNPVWQRELGLSYTKAAVMVLALNGPDAAEVYATNGWKIAEQMYQRDPHNAQWKVDLASSYDTMGDLWLVRNEVEKANSHHQGALDIRLALARTDPSNQDYTRDLLRTYFRCYRVPVKQGGRSKVVVLDQTGLDPMAAFRKQVVSVAGNFFLSKNRKDEDLEKFQEVMTLAEKLAGKDMGNMKWQHELARGHSLLGDKYVQAGRTKSALEPYEKALEIRKQCVGRDSITNRRRFWLAQTHCSLAAALRRLSRHAEAAEEARQAFRLFGTMASQWPKNAVFLEGLRGGKQDIGTKFPIHKDQLLDAIAAFERGFGKASKLAAKNSATETEIADHANYCSERAMIHLFRADVDQAVVEASSAVTAWQKLLQTASNNTSYRTNWMHASVALGAFQLFNRQPRAAIETVRRGLALDPAMVEFKAILAMGYFFDDQTKEAGVILLENRNLKVGPRQTFPEAVMDDLRRLRDKGFTYPDLEKLEKLPASDSGEAPE